VQTLLAMPEIGVNGEGDKVPAPLKRLAAGMLWPRFNVALTFPPLSHLQGATEAGRHQTTARPGRKRTVRWGDRVLELVRPAVCAIMKTITTTEQPAYRAFGHPQR
jgi:hypothetical protein